jgi:RHS repeat-associated protein
LAQYTYDAANLRATKATSSGMVVYHYDLQGHLIAETTATGSTIVEYVWLGDDLLAQVRGGNIYYYHNDHLGTPQVMTGSTSFVVWKASYSPFGKAQVMVNIVENNIRFPGQYFDSETGLHYNRNRYYDPNLGRYVTPDPIGLGGGVNLWTYTKNNPINGIDPWGLFVLPNVPSGLPPGWTLDPSHLDPNGQRFRDSSGRELDYHPGRPSETGWKGKTHWHDPCNSGGKHLRPGTEIPDPILPKIVPPPTPWWQLLIRVPWFIIPNVCIVDPTLPGCGGTPGGT